MPMKELPITTSFFPSFAATEAVSRRTGHSSVDTTCVNLDGIVNAPESEHVLEVDAWDGKPLRLPSWRKDELVVVDKLFPSLQHDLLSNDVDGCHGLRILPRVDT